METRIAKVLGEVILVGDHGIYVDHDGKLFYAVDMDPDGRVASREAFLNPNDALHALKLLKERLTFEKLETPKNFTDKIN